MPDPVRTQRIAEALARTSPEAARVYLERACLRAAVERGLSAAEVDAGRQDDAA